MAKVPVSPAMSEADLQSAIMHRCAWLGLAVYHTHDSRRSQPGFPDLVIAGGQGVMFRELKTAKGRLSKPQEEWLARLPNAAVWRPVDLIEGRVLAELEALR